MHAHFLRYATIFLVSMWTFSLEEEVSCAGNVFNKSAQRSRSMQGSSTVHGAVILGLKLGSTRETIFWEHGANRAVESAVTAQP